MGFLTGKCPVFYLFPIFLLVRVVSSIIKILGIIKILAIDFFDRRYLSWVKFNTQGDQYGKMVAGNTLADDSD
jgi:hypothetical protein